MGGVRGERRRSAPDVACWVLKTRLAPAAIEPTWAPGGQELLRRCLRRSYRLDLMSAGQRCLLWLSGPHRPGVHAIGLLAAAPGPDLAVEVVLHRLAEPVPRALLLDAAPAARAEVVVMPSGSNPSYLTAAQLRPVLDHLGALDPAALQRAGWSPDLGAGTRGRAAVRHPTSSSTCP